MVCARAAAGSARPGSSSATSATRSECRGDTAAGTGMGTMTIGGRLGGGAVTQGVQASSVGEH